MKKTGKKESWENDWIKTAFKYMEVNVSAIKASDIEMIYFNVCLDPESRAFGIGAGAFEYKNGNVYKFRYTIPHTNNAPANNIACIRRVLLHMTSTGLPFLEECETDFGQKAFDRTLFVSDLDGKDKSLRELMISLREYSQRQGWLEQYMIKREKHEIWESNRKAKALNYMFGITGDRFKYPIIP